MAQLNDLLIMGPSTLLGPVNINGEIKAMSRININNGSDLVLRGSVSGKNSDSGDIIFADADGKENARLWWGQSETGGELLHRIAEGTSYKIYHSGNLQFALSGTNNTTLTITLL